MSLKSVAEAIYDAKFKADVAKVSKMWNIPTPVDGILFASKWEAHRWTELRLEEKAGFIRKLERQRPFAIVIDDIPRLQLRRRLRLRAPGTLRGREILAARR